MLRRWCVLLAMLAMTVGTAFTAGTASAATGHAGLGGGGWPWPPPGTQSWVPGGPVNLVSRSFSGKTGMAESTNWSGYAGTTGTYTSVSASWIQPAGHCTSGDQYAAFWVGLDGYSSGTVEQTGSEVDCVGRTAEYYAWYEAYPNASVNYNNTVKAGDSFTATVTWTSGNSYNLIINDITERWSHTTPVTVANAARSSAEVIAEAPCCTFLGGILPLTNFGTMNFTSSTVTPTSGTSEAMGSAPGVTAITMVDNFGRDKDTVSALTPTGLTGENFGCTFVRST
jgi:peptidase A4-like protein